MKKRLIGIMPAGLLLAVAVFLPSLAVTATAAPAVTTSDTPTPAHTLALPDGEQRYIVKYGSEVNSEAESRSLKEQGIDVKETLTHTMKASVVLASPEEIATLEKSADVTSIELDTRVSVSGATSIWGLDRVDQRSGRDGQFSIGDEGAGVNVYVVDSGLNFSHTDFAGRVPTSWWGVHDGRAASDCAGHGTHVAGSVAGTTYGVAKKANIIPVRVLDCNGFGWSSTVMAGIDWAVAHHPAGQPAVMNLSVGGFTNWSFDQSVQGAVNDGITVVAAAGNDGVDACWASPARVPTAITVAATNINDSQASWSNYGSCVDLHAPGVWIRSAWTNAPTGYNTLDGTSMAAPHVAGAAAILLSRDRSMSPAQVHQAMIQNATTGVVNSIKGSTPNRLLFIPGQAPSHPSCSNLQLGSAWAGVGTHCGLKGSAASVPFAGEPDMGVVDASIPAVTAVEAPEQLPTTDTDTPEVPLPGTDATEVPLPTSDAAEVAPVQVPAAVAPVPSAEKPAHAPSKEIPVAFTQYVPLVGNPAPEMPAAEPDVITPGVVVDEVAKEPEGPSTPAVSPDTAVSTPAALPTSGAAAHAGGTDKEVGEKKIPVGPNTAAWLITIGAVLGGLAVTWTVRRLIKPRTAKTSRHRLSSD